MKFTPSKINSAADLIKYNEQNKAAEKQAKDATRAAVKELKNARLAKQAAHLEASYLNEQNYLKARQNLSNVGSKLPKKSYAASRLLRKTKRAVSFTTWKYQRAISKAGNKLVAKFPRLTLPARMLRVVGEKLPFLKRAATVGNFFVKPFLPLARFIPIVGPALGIASIAIPLWQWGNTLLRKPKVIKPNPQVELPPFIGGQSSIGYALIFNGTGYGDNYSTPHPSQGLIQGPIEKIEFTPLRSHVTGAIYDWQVLVTHNGGQLRGLSTNIGGDVQPTFVGFNTFGVPDTGGNIGSTASAPGVIPIRIAQSPINSPWSDYLPGGSKYQPRTADPTRARSPSESNKRKPLQIAIPAGKPITVITPDGNSVTVAPATTPRIINIPRPLPSQTSTPEPEVNRKIAPLPITITSPGSAPIVLTAPSTGKTTISIPGQQPITFDPSGKTPTTGLTANPLTPGKLAPTPTVTPTTTPTTTQPPATPDAIPDIEDLLLPLGIAGGLTGLGLLIKQIHDRTTPQALETAAAAGTCRTTQPGGCTTNAMESAVNSGNQKLGNQINTGLQGLELGALKIIDNKLGAQIPGGLAGGVGRLSNFLGIDRILNLLNFILLLHNASMLTSSLKVTLLEMLSSVGNATGFLQTAEGSNVELNKVFEKGIETFIVGLVGAETYAQMTLSWRKYNSILRAGSNVLSNVGNMFSSIGNGIEAIGERTGKIGNSLRAAGVVRENAYNYMSENMDVHTNKFMGFQTKTGGAIEVLEAINEIAQSAVEGQEAYTESVRATTEFKKALETGEKKPGVDADNLAIKTEAEKIKANLVKDPTGEKETGYFSSLTD